MLKNSVKKSLTVLKTYAPNQLKSTKSTPHLRQNLPTSYRDSGINFVDFQSGTHILYSCNNLSCFRYLIVWLTYCVFKLKYWLFSKESVLKHISASAQVPLLKNSSRMKERRDVSSVLSLLLPCIDYQSIRRWSWNWQAPQSSYLHPAPRLLRFNHLVDLQGTA